MEDTKEDYYFKEGPPGIGKDDDGAMAVQHKLVLDSASKGSMMVAPQCPSFSETSSLFSTVDCSSFSSRSDASSFVKEDISLGFPPHLSGASSSIDSLSKAAAAGYFEFSFLKGRLVEDEEEEQQEGPLAAGSGKGAPDSTRNDAFERLPVRTERTRYCSEEVHTRVNPCFEKTGVTLESRATRSKKLAKSLSSVLSKHLALSPGPAFRRSSCERFSSRVVLDHPSSPSSSDKLYAPTPLRRFGAACLNSSSDNDRLSISSTVSRTERAKLKLEWLASRKTYYTTSPNHRKSLGGCLGGPRTLAEQDYRGPICLASEDSLHGGKNRCLPSPRLSFGHGKALAVFRQDQAENSSLSMVVPSSSARGQLHCFLRGDLPSFTFLVDGSDEVLVAKAVKPASEAGNVLYMFYSWKPRGRARGSWKGWMRRDRTVPDFLGQMTVASKLVPASSKDGDEMHELEFVVRDQRGACSPRLSFSTWETDSSPANSRSPLYSFPSPFCITTPSPCRLPSSRYVSLSMVPANLASPRLEKVRFSRQSRAKPHLSPLRNRARSDDERSSSFQDAWSDTDVAETETTLEAKELAALVMTIPTSGNSKLPGSLANINQAWERANKPVKAAAGTSGSKKNFSCRKLGRVQNTETKENDQNKADRRESNNKDAAAPRSFKLRDLMGVKPDFGKQQQRQEAAAKVTVILPAGNHGVPIQGTAGPEPLVDRWRSGGRCDCGSWDLGCGLTILEGEISSDQQQQKNSLQQQGDSTTHIFSQGKRAMSLAPLDDGISSVSFKAPMSYLQAFASAVVVLYTRGPAPATTTASSSFRKSSPRFPLRPLVADPGYYCSPPPASLLDRL